MSRATHESRLVSAEATGAENTACSTVFLQCSNSIPAMFLQRSNSVPAMFHCLYNNNNNNNVIYHALINALSAHMIHINLNMRTSLAGKFWIFWRGWMTELGVPRWDSCSSQAVRGNKSWLCSYSTPAVFLQYSNSVPSVHQQRFYNTPTVFQTQLIMRILIVKTLP